MNRSSHCKKVSLEIFQNSQENACARVFIQKESLAQVFFCEFYEISKSTFFYSTPSMAASAWTFHDQVCTEKKQNLKFVSKNLKGVLRRLWYLLYYGMEKILEFMDVLVSMFLITWTITWTTCKAFKRRQNVI